MRLLLSVLPLTWACSMKHASTEHHSLMGAQIQILNVSKALVVDTADPQMIQARVYARPTEIERLSVEWWSLEEGLLSVQQPDALGQIQLSTMQLSAGIHTVYANLKEGEQLLQQEKILVVINRPGELQDDISKDNDVALQIQDAPIPHPLLVSNRLMGCDAHSSPQNIWFCTY